MSPPALLSPAMSAVLAPELPSATHTQRCAALLLDTAREAGLRLSSVLEVGCSVGGMAFTLAEHADSVLGVDLSAGAIALANRVKAEGVAAVLADAAHEVAPVFGAVADALCDVGERARSRASFRQMDACCLAPDFGPFDAVALSDVVDKIPSPKAPLGA